MSPIVAGSGVTRIVPAYSGEAAASNITITGARRFTMTSDVEEVVEGELPTSPALQA